MELPRALKMRSVIMTARIRKIQLTGKLMTYRACMLKISFKQKSKRRKQKKFILNSKFCENKVISVQVKIFLMLALIS